MLHNVNRDSMDIARTTGPVYSITCPTAVFDHVSDGAAGTDPADDREDDVLGPHAGSQ
jgi:hypothetical protein